MQRVRGRQMSTATYERPPGSTNSATHSSYSTGVETARAYAAQLRDANEKLARLNSACLASNAFQVNPSDVRSVEREIALANTSLVDTRGPWLVRFQENTTRIALWCRVSLEELTGGSGMPAFMIALFAAITPFGLLLLLSALLNVPPSIGIAAAFVPAILIFVGIVALQATYLPADASREYAELLHDHITRRATIASLEQSLQALRRRHSKLTELLELRQQCEAAEVEVVQLQRFFADRRNQLLLRQYRELRGVPFEQFLVEIFEALGYIVSTTRTTGDQGVDLVAEKGGHRLAIQAKGYTGSVGNDAVQQAFAGKAFYQCTGCIVITNAWFTPSAQELAARVNCLLIDGDRLPELILGRVL